MNENIERYLDQVCGYIRCKEIHAAVREELRAHIVDRVDALVAAGRPEAEAVELALRKMGDPAEVGRGLNRVHRPRTDWSMVAVVLCLVMVGLWASHAASVSESWGPFPLLNHQLGWTAGGVILAAGLCFFDYRRLQPYRWWLYGLAVAATACVGLTSPVSLFAVLSSPLLFVPGLAAVFAQWDWYRHSGWKVAALGAVPSLVYVAVDQGHFVPIYLVLWATLLVLSRPRARRWLPLAVAGFVGTGVLLSVSWQLWLNPSRGFFGGGFWVLQVRRIYAEAGLWGHGALTPESFLPQAHSQSVFPYLVHTLGWIAGGALCLLVLLFLLRVGRAAAQSRNSFGVALVVGCLTVFGMEYVWNVAMLVGWAPLAQVDFPLISFGRLQIVRLAAVGLMLSVYRRKDMESSVAVDHRT